LLRPSLSSSPGPSAKVGRLGLDLVSFLDVPRPVPSPPCVKCGGSGVHGSQRRLGESWLRWEVADDLGPGSEQWAPCLGAQLPVIAWTLEIELVVCG
jgi:hypothetical protein